MLLSVYIFKLLCKMRYCICSFKPQDIFQLRITTRYLLCAAYCCRTLFLTMYINTWAKMR